MSVWLTIPSARPPEEAEKVLKLWRERGYKIALWRDDNWTFDDKPGKLICQHGEYHGYANAVNHLIARLIAREDSGAEWFVIGGDDVHPDPNHSADEIAGQCREYFAGRGPAERMDANTVSMSVEDFERSRTFGVMQPTGDRWGDRNGAYVDRIAGSAWIGREFAKRAYGGNGPLWPGWFHMCVDEELQEVATKLGVFWQRQDLTQLHQHWGRPLPGERLAPVTRMPQFLEKANAGYFEAKKLFAERKAAGFPGHEVL